MNHFLIKDVHARSVLDSRGNPTVEAEVLLECGVRGRAIVPSGASTGIHEAVEKRDGGRRWQGKGVTKAVKAVNTRIKKAVLGLDAREQRKLDDTMIALDGTPNKAKLGANAILAVSIAACRATARAAGKEDYEYLALFTKRKPKLPIPFCNVINGGKHAEGLLKLQEFMIVPVGAESFSDAVRMVSETYHVLKKLLHDRYGAAATHVGDEGGFAPPLKTPEETLDLLVDAVKKAGYRRKIKFALDPATSELYENGSYDIGRPISPEQLVKYWGLLAKEYPIISLEDPFDEDDFLSWHMLSHDLQKRRQLQLVGDDLTVSNPRYIKRAIDERLCNALLLKVNQVGTLSEALDAALGALDAGWNVMVSHRSGETEDPFIADLAVALGCGQIKLGAPCRSDRTAKYNRLLRIEEKLGKKKYAKFKLPRKV